jgi:hypothetical protein
MKSLFSSSLGCLISISFNAYASIDENQNCVQEGKILVQRIVHDRHASIEFYEGITMGKGDNTVQLNSYTADESGGFYFVMLDAQNCKILKSVRRNR